jgi:hypothetical protein
MDPVKLVLKDAAFTKKGHPYVVMIVKALMPVIKELEAKNETTETILFLITRTTSNLVYRDPMDALRRHRLEKENLGRNLG